MFFSLCYDQIQVMNIREEYHRNDVSLYHTSGHVKSVFPIIGDVGFDHVVKIVSISFLPL